MWITQIVSWLLILLSSMLVLLLQKPNVKFAAIIATMMWVFFGFYLMSIAIVKRSTFELTQIGGILLIIGTFWQSMISIGGWEFYLPFYRPTILLRYLLVLVGFVLTIVGIAQGKHGIHKYFISQKDFWLRTGLLVFYVFAFIQDVHLTRHVIYYADSGFPIPFSDPHFIINLLFNLILFVVCLVCAIRVTTTKQANYSIVGGWISVATVVLYCLFEYPLRTVLLVFPFPALLLALNLMGFVMMLSSVSFTQTNPIKQM